MDEIKDTEKCTICNIDVVPSNKRTIMLNGNTLIVRRSGNFNSVVLKKFKKSKQEITEHTQISFSTICNICHEAAKGAHDFRKECNESSALQELLVPEKPLINRQGFKNASTQTEPPESATVIVQGISSYHLERDLEDVFSEYGEIQSIYLPNRSRKKSSQFFARITFATEDDALKVWNAGQRREIKVNSSVWPITLLSEGYSPIGELPDNCLKKIFSCVDKKEDKLSLERVCKRWEKLGAESWTNFTKLSDRNSVWGNFDTNEKLTAIFQRSGSYLKSLELHVLHDPELRLPLVSQYCENLEDLQLWFNFYNQYPVQTSEFCDCIESILRQSSKLRRLFMAHIDHQFDFSHVQYLSENMTEIHLHAQKINNRGPEVTMDLSKIHNLVALGLFNLILNEDSLRGLQNLKRLKYLSFKGSYVDSSILETIQDLTTLTYLAIPNCQMNDELLSRIVLNNANLAYLDISGIKDITDEPFKYIVHLPKLQVLRMNHLPKVKGTHLSQIQSLDELHCVGCTSMVDWSLMMMIESCPRISEIYAAGVATWRLLLSAEETIKSDTLMRFYNPIDLCVDENLAEKWWMYKPNDNSCPTNGYGDPLLEIAVDLTEDDSLDVDPQNWEGWFANDKRFTSNT